VRELAALAGIRLRMLRHAAAGFLRGSRLRLAVVCGLALGFWLLMLAMFFDAFRFIAANFHSLSDVLMDYLFAFFFLTLLVMMTISNAIIAYTSLFRSAETAFLFSLPLRPQSTFAYRGADSIVFSLWSMTTLMVPMLLAYGMVFPAPWYYYAMAAVLAGGFMLLATELGAFLALLVGWLLPRRKKALLAALGLAAAAAAVRLLIPLFRESETGVISESTLKHILGRIAFSQHWALPSEWVASGLLSAGRGSPGPGVFYTLMLLANALFLGMVSYWLAGRVYGARWQVAQSGGSSARRRRPGLADVVPSAALVFLPFRLRRLVLKDLKTFLRDAAQWSQFLLFFGLLGLYIANLPRLRSQFMQPYWQSLVASLNLGATCLTLATLTSRFVFPQLSLEGRRIWITGLLPMSRALILWGKFTFAALGTFLVSAGLIALSDVFMGLPGWMLRVHLLVVLCVCAGLNGMAVGLGALYPRPGTDNPSKIVSSFGGTLNLICSIGFIALALGPVVVPLHLHMVGVLEGRALTFWLGAGLAAVFVLSAAACLAPMLAGARAFRRMEF